ncbi:MAG: helicase-related protein [Rhodospirillaceae bacterium]|nr:helicase-related protein [Rhodospirillaceae bacterium]
MVFTEHRDTLRYLQERITTLLGRQTSVVVIHGSVGREERLAAQEAFRHDPQVQVLLATDAAGTQKRRQHGHRHEERGPVLAKQAGRLHPRSRPVRQRRRRHTARALRPAAVPAGTGFQGGKRQLRAQGPVGQRGEPAVGRAAGSTKRNSRDTRPGGQCRRRMLTASLAARQEAVDGVLSGGRVRGVRYAADDVVPDRSAELRAGGRGELGR